MKLEVANTMTLQELFDYSMDKLVQQGQRCMADRDESRIRDAWGDACAYGNSRQQHCGIGWTLDEDDCDLMNFRGTVKTLVKSFPHLIPQPIVDNLNIASIFQRFHDRKGGKVSNLTELLTQLNDNGIDTSKPHWQQWIRLHPDTRIDVGSRVRIRIPTGSEFEDDRIGTVTNRDGDYILVRRDLSGVEIELYPVELELLPNSVPDQPQ